MIAVALLLLSSTLPAQSIGPLPPLTAHVDVQVVNVDVTVTDMDGKPVTDLNRADFELYEDGKMQKISNFYVVRDSAVGEGASPAPGTPKGEVPAEFRRKVLLVVDNNYIEKAERNIALTKMEKYVTSRFGAEWGLVVVGHAAEIVQPFTTDVAAIHAAFDRARATSTFFVHHEIDRSILSDRTRRHLDLSTS
jgi:VWFA-related protein